MSDSTDFAVSLPTDTGTFTAASMLPVGLLDTNHVLLLADDVAPDEVEALALSQDIQSGWVGVSSLQLFPGGPSCTGVPATTWPSMGYWPRTWCPRVSTTWPRGTSVWVWSTRFLTATRPASSSRSPSTRANRAPARSAPFMAPLRPRSP